MAQRLKQKVFGDSLTTTLLGVDSSERNLKHYDLAAYRYLVFATHGLPASAIESLHEPSLVLSQIGLDATNDGFLTLSEAAALETHADLVALTACNTGVGKRVGGEGVLALSRAFQEAGAKGILASMWPIAEDASTALLESFFLELQSGASAREALRHARMAIRRQGFEHPFYWGSMVLFGL